MTDVFTPDKRSSVMRRVKGKDTSPELKVRRLLTRMGLRYRLHRKDLPGKPDIVMPGRRLAIFVHGCFWHGHDCPRGARTPKANRPYWEAKIGGNRERDIAHRAALQASGWRVLTLWECELKDEERLERSVADLLSLPLDRSYAARSSPRSARSIRSTVSATP
ncbi:MAG: very short patch repair endonuclease [Caulobacteraceae bacterium]|jgi:DNA mismatch endonuclease (patch repair protein)|nr:very short patch repair endonuclease [Caulobacteraceae bacterium]